MTSHALPMMGYLPLNAFNAIKTISTMRTKLTQVSQNMSFIM